MISRRCFVKTGVLAGASFYATFPATAARLLEETLDFPGAAAAAGARVVRLGCPSHNCGGR
ncbi:MAG: hypothetical protein EHM24_25240, partial [Acidobacteria bacterium]